MCRDGLPGPCQYFIHLRNKVPSDALENTFLSKSLNGWVYLLQSSPNQINRKGKEEGTGSVKEQYIDPTRRQFVCTWWCPFCEAAFTIFIKADPYNFICSHIEKGTSSICGKDESKSNRVVE